MVMMDIQVLGPNAFLSYNGETVAHMYVPEDMRDDGLIGPFSDAVKQEMVAVETYSSCGRWEWRFVWHSALGSEQRRHKMEPLTIIDYASSDDAHEVGSAKLALLFSVGIQHVCPLTK